MAIETPLIGSGSQEEADARVAALIGLGKSRGYLTYDELNERLPDEVVSPDKLDSLLMMIDEMGIKLIDDMDVAEFQAKGSKKIIVVPIPTPKSLSAHAVLPPRPVKGKPEEKPEVDGQEEEDDDEIDLNLE